MTIESVPAFLSSMGHRQRLEKIESKLRSEGSALAAANIAHAIEALDREMAEFALGQTKRECGRARPPSSASAVRFIRQDSYQGPRVSEVTSSKGRRAILGGAEPCAV